MTRNRLESSTGSFLASIFSSGFSSKTRAEVCTELLMVSEGEEDPLQDGLDRRTARITQVGGRRKVLGRTSEALLSLFSWCVVRLLWEMPGCCKCRRR